jgi:cytochrome c
MGWMLERSRHLPSWDSQSSLAEVQKSLGDQLPDHQIQLDSQLVRMGEELVKYGRTIGPNNKRSSFISKYYVCTTCHNLVQEDPDLSVSDPETRLDYAIEHQLPFLQGTTFKGIVNRESWYNDDYVKKYGDEKVKIAHENLREAIQLCAIECSQGRPMKDWEVEAVLAYFWTLEYTLGDLGLTQNDLDFLNKLAPTSEEKTVRTQWLRSFYSTKSPAHFYDAPIDKKIGYPGFTPDASRGQAIYELSCLSCHQPNGVSHYILDQSKLSFKHLEKMIEKDSHFSLYQIIAYGTYAIPGHRPYMPHYPEERMSKKQVEDLRAFIEEMAQ